jgi:peptidyl-prolyl cis-trans isomerase A (cyclophilin A)
MIKCNLLKIFLLPVAMVFFSCYHMAAQKTGKTETVVIKTELGNIYARLYLRKAPVTCTNFLKYVDSALYDSSCFYRVVRMDNQPGNIVKIQVIQGGRYENEEKGFLPVEHESTLKTGIRHRDGALSMARSEPGTATSEFFICIGNQPELDFAGKRNPDGQGFAAFGKIVKGMDVVMQIHTIRTTSQYLEKPVLIRSIERK